MKHVHHNFFKILVALLSIILLNSCPGPPDPTGEFDASITGKSILSNSTIKVFTFDENMKELDDVTINQANDNGLFSINKIKKISRIRIESCGGEFFNSAINKKVPWNGCLYSDLQIDPEVKEYQISIDFISTMIAVHSVSKEEPLSKTIDRFKNYLDISKQCYKEDDSLTDCSKLYILEQALAHLSVEISKNNNVSPETSLSTEFLILLIFEDLMDNDIIDGSTKNEFGKDIVNLKIDQNIFRKKVVELAPNVSDKFSKTDLDAWLNHLKTEEASFLKEIENPPLAEPEFEIISPKNNSIVSKVLRVRAEKTPDDEKTKYLVTSLTCSLWFNDGETFIDLVDKNEDQSIFEADIDTLYMNLDDGKYQIICKSSNGKKVIEKKVLFSIKNRNEVVLSAHIVNPVRNFDKVEVYTFDNLSSPFKTIYEQNGEIRTYLPEDDYLFKSYGGIYKSDVILKHGETESEYTLSDYLFTRANIKTSDSLQKVFMNPITTIREHIYVGLTMKDDPKADQKSLALIKHHFDDVLNIYEKPFLAKPGESRTKLALIISSLERLALYFSNKQNLSPGSITIDNILYTVKKDIADFKALFDGQDDHDKQIYLTDVEIDSYFFRFHYAVAMKMLLEESPKYNLADFKALINRIAQDESELFPSDARPKDVAENAPEIKNLKFKNPSANIFKEYKDPENLPYT